MSQEEGKSGRVIDDLTPQQLDVLNLTLKEVQEQLYHATIKRIQRNAMVVGGILLGVVGIAIFGARYMIVAQVTDRLSQNAEIKHEVSDLVAARIRADKGIEERAQAISTKLDKLESTSDSLSNRLEVEEARISAVLVTELEEIHQMLDQIRADVLEPGRSDRDKEP